MAAVNYTRGVKLVLKVGDGASPEVFTALCTVNAERGVSFDGTFRDENVPDCNDPDLLAWVVREAESLSMGVTGGGMSHKNDVKRLWDWWKSGESKNAQVILDDDTPANVILWEGGWKLTNFDLNGNRGEKVASTLTLASDGEIEAEFGANVGGT